MTALGFGLAGQMLGLWVGAVAGATDASQRLFVPLAPEAGGQPAATARPSATVTNIASAKPVLKVVPKPEPAPKIVAKVEPAPKIVAKVEPVAKAKVEPVAKVVAKPEPEPKTVAKAEPVKKAAVKTAPAKPAATKAAPAKPAVAKAAPAKPVAAPAAKAAAPKAAVATASTALLPEDFRQPRRLEQPAAPDDLKAISGVGPKLEKVLNELGVWTYAQIAAWSGEEVAWVDDYLSFAGRIGRDKWIEQAATLAAASAKKPAKG
jgi:NADH-quinone oxidoreductase subunit E